MSRQPDEIVAVEAGQLTVVGTPDEVERFAAAAGLYGQVPNAKSMSSDDDHIMTGVYIGVGLLVAAGAGYLAWRYLMSEEQKERAVNTAKDLVADGVTRGKRALRDGRGKLHM
jgi:hypothetical protein